MKKIEFNAGHLILAIVLPIALIVILALVGSAFTQDKWIDTARNFAQSREETFIDYVVSNQKLYIKTDVATYECANLTTDICFKVTE